MHFSKIALGALLFASFFCLLVSDAQAGVLTKPANNLGMVAYYPMDEGTGSVVGDYSGQNLSGTTANGPTWNATADSKFGRSLLFAPASSQYITVPHSGALNFSTQMTFAAWVKGTLGNQLTIITKGDYGDAFRVLIQGGTVGERVPAIQLKGSTILGTTAIVSGSWTHIAFTYDGAATKIYVNGSLTDTSTAVSGALSTTATAMYIGQGGSNSLYFDGTIDDVRLFQRALTTAEISNIYNRVPTGGKERSRVTAANQNRLLTSGLGSLWSFNANDVSGSTAYDRAGSANGTLINGPTTTAGKIGQALNFDGLNDYVSSTNNVTSNGSSRSIAAWIYPDSVSTMDFVAIESTLQSTSPLVLFGFRSSALSVYHGGDYRGGATTLTPGRWYHVVYTYDSSGNVVKIYLNGNQDYSNTHADAYGGSSVNIGVGYGGYFDGKIDEVRLYSRALTPTEVLQLYHGSAGRVKEEQNSFLTSGLLAYWSFNGADSTATTTRDISGTGNTLYLQGTARFGLGKVGQGLQITGVNAASHASTSASVLDPSTTDFTATAWFKPSILNATNDAILSQETGSGTNGRNWLFVAASTSKLGSAIGGTLMYSTSTLRLNHWHHGAVSMSGTTRRLYLDGVLENSTTTTAEAANGVFAVGKGIVGVHNQNFPGVIDEVRIYNRALSDSEILQLYQKIR